MGTSEHARFSKYDDTQNAVEQKRQNCDDAQHGSGRGNFRHFVVFFLISLVDLSSVAL